jgi:hypothetical protein
VVTVSPRWKNRSLKPSGFVREHPKQPTSGTGTSRPDVSTLIARAYRPGRNAATRPSHTAVLCALVQSVDPERSTGLKGMMMRLDGRVFEARSTSHE